MHVLGRQKFCSKGWGQPPLQKSAAGACGANGHVGPKPGHLGPKRGRRPGRVRSVASRNRGRHIEKERREGGREGGRVGGRVGGWEGGREGGREGGSVRGREAGGLSKGVGVWCRESALFL